MFPTASDVERRQFTQWLYLAGRERFHCDAEAVAATSYEWEVGVAARSGAAQARRARAARTIHQGIAVPA